MDFGQLPLAVTAINTAKQLAQAAVAVRDFNQMADVVAKLNAALLQAQESLFTHNAQFAELQGKYLEASEELRKLKEAAAKRESYSLFEIASGHWAYRSNVVPQQSGASEPSAAQAPHYLCQPCFDGGRTAVLHVSQYAASCPTCKVIITIRARDLDFARSEARGKRY